MSDIDELQRRIAEAMGRIGQGVEGLAAAQKGADAALMQELEDERTANAQLNERVRVLKTRSDAEIAALRAQSEENTARLAQLDVELQKVRRINDQLREACSALRTANAEGVGEAHLINRAMQSELESLRAIRAADVAEANAILGSLSALVDGADTAEETENA